MYYVNKGEIFHRIENVDLIGKPSDVQKCLKFKALLLQPQFFEQNFIFNMHILHYLD